MNGGLDQFIQASSQNGQPLTTDALDREMSDLWRTVGSPMPHRILVSPRTMETARFFEQTPRWKFWVYRMFKSKMRRDLDAWLIARLPKAYGDGGL